MIDKILNQVYINEGIRKELYIADGYRTVYGIVESMNQEWLNAHNCPNVEDLTEELRDLFYREKIKAMNIDLINSIDLAYNVFDMGINSGSRRSIKMLQNCLNFFRGSNKISVDGVIGKNTARAISNVVNIYSEPVLVEIYMQARKNRYMQVLAYFREEEKYSDKKLMDFLESWNRRVKKIV